MAKQNNATSAQINDEDPTAGAPTGDDTMVNGAGEKQKRGVVAKRVYLDAKGQDAGRNAPANASGLEFRFSSGDVRKINPADFSDDIRTRAMWHGFNQKLGDSFASAKGDPKEALALFDETYDQLREGDWITEREGGGVRTTYLVEALARIRARRDGVSDPSTLFATIAENIKSWPDEKKAGASKNPQVAAELAQIAAERAMERAKKAAAEAGSTSGAEAGADELGSLLG